MPTPPQEATPEIKRQVTTQDFIRHLTATLEVYKNQLNDDGGIDQTPDK